MKKPLSQKISYPLTALGWLISLLFLGPLYIMFINSFKMHEQIFTDQLGLPEKWQFGAYVEAARKMDYLNSLKNSLLVVGISVICIIVVSSMAAWAISRRNTKGSSCISCSSQQY